MRGIPIYAIDDCRHTLILDTTGLDMSSLPDSLERPLHELTTIGISLGIEDTFLSSFEMALCKLSVEHTDLQQHLLCLDRVDLELHACLEEAKYREALVDRHAHIFFALFPG